MKIDFDVISKADISQLKKLRDTIDSYIETLRDMNFLEVTILNYNGNVTKEIKEKFPEFKVWWTSENPGTIGENHVIVPSEKWNDDVKKALSEFDSFVGHHVEKHTEYEVKEGVELPFGVKQEIEHKKGILSSYGKPVEKIRFSTWEVNNNYNLKMNLEKFLVPVEVITREWDDELWVRDSRNYASFENLKKISIEL